ncbi:MAG: sugar phosphate isomerase/epimerase [Coxiellaceae bacterium]|nr:sugar phosphate isomerase/epimerase [Coxiellaceae bacterium]
MTDIGFIQGRLSPIVDEKIQAFPWQHWRQEFQQASEGGFFTMEWTLDDDDLYSNPLMTEAGQIEIKQLCEQFNLSIPSLTGDFCMQAPFYKANHESECSALFDTFLNVLGSCQKLNIEILVVPLVDNGSLQSQADEQKLISILNSAETIIRTTGVKIAFESDYEPLPLKQFIDKLPSDIYGINYDIGNSAALGYDPVEEINTYSNRILNVHIKDRVLGGTTVPLGQGNVDLKTVFSRLKQAGYLGRYILQTARATNESHLEVLCNYREMVKQWI